MKTAKLISKFNPFSEIDLRKENKLFFGIINEKYEWEWIEVSEEYADKTGHKKIFEELEKTTSKKWE